MIMTLEDWKKAREEVYKEARELTAKLSEKIRWASEIEMICAILEQEAGNNAQKENRPERD